jgi:hypothetical protein
MHIINVHKPKTQKNEKNLETQWKNQSVPILYFTYDIKKKFVINAIELVHHTTVSVRQQWIYYS